MTEKEASDRRIEQDRPNQDRVEQYAQLIREGKWKLPDCNIVHPSGLLNGGREVLRQAGIDNIEELYRPVPPRPSPCPIEELYRELGGEG